MIDDAPLVTVVIPTFNRVQTLCRSIESVLHQNYLNWELLIVDDGSTDETKELIQTKYLNKPNIYFIERPQHRPKGANACRNIGAEKGKGKYVAFLDSDDEWLPFHLEYKLQILNDSGAKFNFGAFLVLKRHTSFEKKCLIKSDATDIENYMVSRQADISTPTFLLDRQSFLSIKFDEYLGKHQDLDFALRYCIDESFIVNHRPTVKVYVGHERMSSGRNHEATLRFLAKHGSKLKRSTYKHFVTNVGLRTYLVEGNSSAFKKYSEDLRKLRGFGGIKYYFAAYILPFPIINYFLRPLAKIYKKFLK